MLEVDGFAVNILRHGQRHLSTRFARTGADKWAAVNHTLGRTGSPVLDGSLAHFECVPHAHHDGGDHVIFVGRVISFSWSEAETPLLFFRGDYCDVARLTNASGN